MTDNGSGTAPPPVLAISAAAAAEVLGTFMLTFAGTATVLATGTGRLQSGPDFTVVDALVIGLGFALGIVAAVYTVARISGAHINPAVTIGLASVGKFPWRLVPVYLVAQVVGAVLAGLVNWLMFGSAGREMALGGTQPGAGVEPWVALVTEAVITSVLVIVVMATAVFERAPGQGLVAGLAIGFWVGVAVFLALPISGASLNPARTLGPDIVAGDFTSVWIYLLGPIAGGILGAVLWQSLLARGDQEVVEDVASG